MLSTSDFATLVFDDAEHNDALNAVRFSAEENPKSLSVDIQP